MKLDMNMTATESFAFATANGCWSQRRYPRRWVRRIRADLDLYRTGSAWTYSASLHVVGVAEPGVPLPALRSPSCTLNEISELFISAIKAGTR